MKINDVNNDTEDQTRGATMRLPYPDPYQLISLAVQRAYHDLRGRGYACYADLLCCQTCALSVIDGDKYVFWHRQDADLAEESGTLGLAWCGDGDEIVRAMRAMGLDVEWGGDKGKRIVVKLLGESIKEAA